MLWCIVCVYGWIDVWMDVWISARIYLWIYVCMDGWMNGCMYVCICVCKMYEYNYYQYMYMYGLTCAHTHTHIYIYIYYMCVSLIGICYAPQAGDDGWVHWGERCFSDHTNCGVFSMENLSMNLFFHKKNVVPFRILWQYFETCLCLAFKEFIQIYSTSWT